MTTRKTSIWRTICFLLVGLLAACSKQTDPVQPMPSLAKVTVYKSPTCGCCEAWVDHLIENGFEVAVVDEPQMNPLKGSLGVPNDLRSCHTAKVDGYIIEGHVPASDIQRLLVERPDVQGLAAPNMPIGSPGMEMGTRVDPYRVMAFSADSRTVFAEHGQH
ncbi:MAG: CopG family transcriptional regulator [Xanthomonadales bacterium]|nr:CopG family transcriptional regulator [Xanthomonadales bacterium]